jgi:hypothetical protein
VDFVAHVALDYGITCLGRTSLTGSPSFELQEARPVNWNLNREANADYRNLWLRTLDRLGVDSDF